jgi:hypothetical protein
VADFNSPRQSSPSVSSASDGEKIDNRRSFTNVEEDLENDATMEVLNDQFYDMNLRDESCYLYHSLPNSRNPSFRSNSSASVILIAGSNLKPQVPSTASTSGQSRQYSTGTRSTKKIKSIKAPKVTKQASLGRPRKTKSKLKTTAQTEAGKQPSRTAKGKRKYFTDTSWHDRLRESILADQELYSRILRYEACSPFYSILRSLCLRLLADITRPRRSKSGSTRNFRESSSD